ncbi:MAG: NAD(P) transhydrogenase subunit alpha [Treponema sp.]|jgi:NAD(P) transhydrogenase subunit alpha|nr:NAD(P) transhydrogenase subunit alpha [Treponema sp.]
MTIGVPKEIMKAERRVGTIPETVEKFVTDGHKVLIEKSAGEGAFFSDSQYRAAGAEIVDDAADLYRRSDLIIKVKEPQFNTNKNMHEVDMMHEGQYLLCFLHPASTVNHEMVSNLAKKGVIGLTLEGIPRITRAQNMDALTTMSTCAGYKGMIMAVNDLPMFAPQITCAIGTTKPINALIIGAGVAGLQAIATAKRLGAVVHAIDIRPDAAEQAKSLGAKIIDLGVPPEISVGSGGYANSLPDEWLKKERDILAESVKQMDIVFCSALIPGKLAQIIITEEMVIAMKPGSVIVDISIDQGGNCAITPPGEVAVKHGVTINGIKNIPGHLPTSSTWMFANNACNIARYLIKDNKLSLDMSDEIVSSTIVTIDGKVVHPGTLEAMGK